MVTNTKKVSQKSVVYVTGGARSGKSRYALEVALGYERRAYVATAEPFDDEMKVRIARHQAERKGQFMTLEEPLQITRAIEEIAPQVDVVLLDCLTVWLNNLMYHNPIVTLEHEEIVHFLALLKNPPVNLVIVSNELGMGIVPENQLAREYRDLAGFLNQAVASAATEGTFMVSGLPISLR